MINNTGWRIFHSQPCCSTIPAKSGRLWRVTQSWVKPTYLLNKYRA